MTSYVHSTLIPDEEVICEAKVSPWSLLPQLVLGFLLLSFWGVGLVFWLAAFIRYKTTELAFTNKRVIAEFGIVSRKSIELNVSKVEDVQVKQSVFGRVFNFGTLVISGEGDPRAPIPGISAPMSFRRSLMAYHDHLGRAER